MKECDIKRLGFILAIQAEIEGMKTDNQSREMQELLPAYTGDDFAHMSEKLTLIVNMNNDQI